MTNRKIALAVAVAVALTMVTVAAGQSGTYVGGHDKIGLAAISDWTTTADLTARTLTVTGVVQNRSNVTLANVRVGVSDEDLVEVPTVPATLAPGAFGTFTATLYTGTNMTVSAYVMADPVTVRFVPWSER